MGFIYKITNDINNKIYIGKTELSSVEKRFKQHIYDSTKLELKNRPLYAAMRKYGIEHFSIEQLEQCNTSILSEREKYWIEYYHSYSNGYNATRGGDGKNKYDYEQIYNEYIAGATGRDLKLKYGLDVSTFGRIMLSYNIDAQLEQQKRAKIKYGKKCSCYDKNNNKLQSFLSLSDAARWIIKNNKSSSDITKVATAIGRVCNKIKRTAYGYIWKSEE